jgi:hypothetical protein
MGMRVGVCLKANVPKRLLSSGRWLLQAGGLIRIKSLTYASQANNAKEFILLIFGNLAILLRTSTPLKTHGFASPPLDGFAFIGLVLLLTR